MASPAGRRPERAFRWTGRGTWCVGRRGQPTACEPGPVARVPWIRFRSEAGPCEGQPEDDDALWMAEVRPRDRRMLNMEPDWYCEAVCWEGEEPPPDWTVTGPWMLCSGPGTAPPDAGIPTVTTPGREVAASRPVPFAGLERWVWESQRRRRPTGLLVVAAAVDARDPSALVAEEGRRRALIAELADDERRLAFDLCLAAQVFERTPGDAPHWRALASACRRPPPGRHDPALGSGPSRESLYWQRTAATTGCAVATSDRLVAVRALTPRTVSAGGWAAGPSGTLHRSGDTCRLMADASRIVRELVWETCAFVESAGSPFHDLNGWLLLPAGHPVPDDARGGGDHPPTLELEEERRRRRVVDGVQPVWRLVGACGLALSALHHQRHRLHARAGTPADPATAYGVASVEKALMWVDACVGDVRLLMEHLLATPVHEPAAVATRRALCRHWFRALSTWAVD